MSTSNRRKAKPVAPVQRRRVREIAPNSQQQAILVRTPDAKPWLLAPDEVTTLKNAICKGATDDQMKFCLTVARRYELDPFQQQIWFVPRWDSQAERSDGKIGATVYVPVVGINGLLHVAARDHRDYGSFSEPEYGPPIEIQWQHKGQGPYQKLMVPEWCRIECYKKGDPRPTVAKIWWEEIYPNVDYAPLVRRMPRLMLAKCAKANACRTAYPKTGGLLIQEETQTREFQNVTPEGRIIVETLPPETGECGHCGRALSKVPNGCPEPTCPLKSKLTAAQREVVKQKTTGAEPRKAGTADTVPAGDAGRIGAPQPSVSAERPTAPKPIEVFYTWSNEHQRATFVDNEALRSLTIDLKRILTKYWDGKAVVMDAETFEAAKFEFETRNITLRRLLEPGEKP